MVSRNSFKIFMHFRYVYNNLKATDLVYFISYTRKNAQVVAILMKTGLNSALLPTLFTVVNNIEQYCHTRFRLNNIVQYC